MPRFARGAACTAVILCLLSKHLVHAQDSPWDPWPFCSRTCAGSASCDTPTAPCVCSSIFLGCVKFSTCNGADEAATMALVDPICGTVNGITPDPPAPPSPTTPKPRTPNATQTPNPSPTPTPTPTVTDTTIPNTPSSLLNSQSSGSQLNSQKSSGTTSPTQQSPTLSGPGSVLTAISADANFSPTTIPVLNASQNDNVTSATRGPVIGGVIAGTVVLIGLVVMLLRRRRAKRFKDAESSETDVPSQNHTMRMVIPTPGLTPYAYQPPAADSDATESLPSTMDVSSSKSGLRHRNVANPDDIESPAIPLKGQVIPPIHNTTTEPQLAGPSTAAQSETATPRHDETANTSSSPPVNISTNSAGTRPFSMTSQDIAVAGPELLPPPYHLIPGNV